MAKDRSQTSDSRRGAEDSKNHGKHRSGSRSMSSKPKHGASKRPRHSKEYWQKQDRKQKAKKLIDHHLPRPWIRWRNENGEDDMAWMPAEIRAGLNKLDECSPWLRYLVYAKTWNVFTGQQMTSQDTGVEEPVPSAAPTTQSIPQTPQTTDAREAPYSQDSGYMSDVVSPGFSEKEKVKEANTSRKPVESMPTLGPDDGSGEPHASSSVVEQSRYAVNLQEPGASQARTLYCFDGLGQANKFAKRAFHGCCDYALGQALLILTRAYRPKCKPLEAVYWWRGDGTVRFEWCDELGREGMIAVERQSVHVSAMVDVTH